MDQPGNNHLLLRAGQPAPPARNGQPHNGQPHNGQAYNGQPGVADRMRGLLARTVRDHLVEERSVASALHDIHQRLNTMDYAGPDSPAATLDGLAATIEGLAATIGAMDSKLTARLERLDERLDDQYDRVRLVDGKLDRQSAATEEVVAKAVEAATSDIIGRIASLEDTVLTLAEALLRPAGRTAQPASPPAAINGHSVPGRG